MRTSFDRIWHGLLLAGVIIISLGACSTFARAGETYISARFGAPLDYALEHNKFTVDLAPGFGGCGAVGHEFARLGFVGFDVEGEFCYLRNRASNLQIIGQDVYVKDLTMTANGLARFGRGWFQPYAGAGIGLDVKCAEIGNLDRGSTCDPGLAYKLIGGVDFRLTRAVKIGARYTRDNDALISLYGKIQNDHWEDTERNTFWGVLTVCLHDCPARR